MLIRLNYTRFEEINTVNVSGHIWKNNVLASEQTMNFVFFLLFIFTVAVDSFLMFYVGLNLSLQQWGENNGNFITHTKNEEILQCSGISTTFANMKSELWRQKSESKTSQLLLVCRSVMLTMSSYLWFPLFALDFLRLLYESTFSFCASNFLILFLI